MVAALRLLDAPFRADKEYGYLVPDSLVPDVFPGRICVVPFGKGNKPVYGVVTQTKDLPSEEESVHPYKTIQAVLSPHFALTEEILKLCFFLREHTLCSVGEALRSAMPVSALGLLEERYKLSPSAPALPLNGRENDVFRFLAEFPEGKTLKEIGEVFGDSGQRLCKTLLKKGLVVSETRLAKEPLKTVKLYSVSSPAEAGELLTRPGVFRTEGQRAVYAFLLKEGTCSEKEITERLGVSPASLRSLAAKGILSVSRREESRDPYAEIALKTDASPVVLSRAQQKAYETLTSLYKEKKAACALLFGVTGSGKTRVMMKLLDDVLEEGNQAILLIPEIALTPQTVGIFCARYGKRVAVLHSSLSAGERFDMYRKIKNGDADLVIGTRSAVFAPLPRLKLIIIDEEHEHTYKSEQNPRYHTRDVAAWRSGYHNALTVLASATPSVEDFYRAKTGKYTLVPLTERYGGALLPQTQIADMREEYKSGNLSPFSRLMTERLEDAKAQGKQAILFLNRRGYHHAVSCKNCGAALECPHCSVALTYHTDWKSGYLLCHACGYKTFMPKTCPGCQSEHLSFVGFGTQKAEADLSSLSDKFRVIRMDADTTSSKTAYDRLLSRFRQGDADVLLGTQMVTKGHDFPNVTLSGVLSADTSLYANDFRAAERTFSLLTQVIGRAGRAASPGTAVIQTFSPDNQVIRLAAKQDYEAFYEAEIALRRSLGNPPFSDIAEVLLSASDENQLMKASSFAKEKIIALFREQAPDSRMELYGPLEPATYRIAGKCRLKISCKCRLASSIRHLFGEVLLLLGETFPKVSASVDFNPLSV